MLHRLLEFIESDQRGIDLSAVGLTDGSTRLTWAEYADAVARLAGALHEDGVRVGDRVAVHLRKSVHSFVAVHAVLRAGGIMVPLDPLAPAAHVRSVLADAAAKAVVTDVAPKRLADLLADTGVGLVVARRPAGAAALDDGGVRGVGIVGWDDAVAAQPGPAADVGPDAPAYVIYTSGSTGRPKGIVHTHASALAYARLAADTYGLGRSDVLANVASLHFDQSTFELYAAPLAGAAVLVVPDAVLRFPASTSELIERERVTVWYSVPHVLRQLVARGALDQRDLSALRWILFGGEVYPPGELRDLMRAVPSARCSNVYGPAEVNQCTFFHLDEPPPSDRPVPIGRAWAETELAVVDEDLRPAADGSPGELLVSSPTMMRDYWRRPDLTAAAIVTDPVDRRRWYRTGDLVVRDEAGDLVFLGRFDHQVKIRGQRIELEAVEAALLDTDGVLDGGVVVRPGPDGPTLVAAVILADDAEPRSIAKRIGTRVPPAAVPTDIVRVDSLPRTASGKIDRSALLRALSEHPSAPAAEPAHDSSTDRAAIEAQRDRST